MKKEFEWTWVVYDEDDRFGELLSLFTLAPIFIMVMYATLVVFQRDLHILFMLLGQLLNEFLNKLLKKFVRQERPTGALMSGNGMPSAHSQFIAFFATYVVLYTWKRLHSKRLLEQWLTMLGVSSLALVVAYSRLRLGYHSTEQVIVGALIGMVTGATWQMLLAKIGPLLFPRLHRWRLAQFFFLRDCSCIADLIVFQHQQVESMMARKYQ